MWNQDIIQAGVYDDAYSYYRTYGNEMRFLPGDKNDGEIYYATVGKKNESAGTRYTTIGWKVRVFNSKGVLVDTVYYKLGGNYMTEVDVDTKNGYEYCLYRVTLENLKSRLSTAGIQALNQSDCNIIFDACISVRKNGVLQGGMTDAGPNWGEVHTSYNGIVHAAPWSEATKESLNSYYNKTVNGLFYDVTLEKGKGILQVSGAGKYCFGSTVNIQAECEAGYHFNEWTGSLSVMNSNAFFVMYGSDIKLTANAKENSYKILFNLMDGKGNIPNQKIGYESKILLPKEGITKENATLSGWEIKEKEHKNIYAIGQEISMSDLVKKLGLERRDGAEIVFYASWDEGPMIQTEEIYVSLADASAGKVTEEWLAKRTFAYDVEDGEIPYGRNAVASFYMENYQVREFIEIQEEGSINKTFCAIDSVGNRTKKDIWIHIIDAQIYPEEKIFGRVRFISKKYFWDEEKKLISEEMGGLAEDSVWRLDENYRRLLEKLYE